MRYSTLMTTLCVLGASVTASAQDFRGNYIAPVNSYTPSYGSTSTFVGQPCWNGRCSTTIPPVVAPFRHTTNYRLPGACLNGRCGHPQHLRMPVYTQPYGTSGCVNGSCAPVYNRYPSQFGTTCPGGVCAPAYGTPLFPTNYGRPGYYGASIDTNNSDLQLNISSTIPRGTVPAPNMNSQSLNPGNTPYYN